MPWLKRNLALLVLILAVGAGAALHLSGKLRVEWGGKQDAAPHAGHDHGGEGEHEEGTSHIVDGKVVLDRDVVATAGILTAPVSRGSVAVSLTVTGEVQLAEDRVAHVTPRIPGAIREVHKTLGDEVAEGTPLATVESVDLGEARAAFVSAISERTLTERNYERWKELFEKGLKTQNELWAAENAFTRAKLNVEAGMGKLKALGIAREEIEELEKGGTSIITNRYQVRSPIAGSILDRHATLGENVEAKDQMFLVADLAEVWVQAAVYVKDLSAVRNGMRGSVKIQGLPERTFKGSVTYVGQRVDEKTRTAAIRIAIKNEPLSGTQERFALRPGMFATVDLETSRRDDVLVVPLPAIQTVAGETVVFVQDASAKAAAQGEHDPPREAVAGGHEESHDGHEHETPQPGAVAFERRVVALGGRDGVVAEVLKGVEVGEAVVVKNAYLLKSEFEKSRISEGHAH